MPKNLINESQARELAEAIAERSWKVFMKGEAELFLSEVISGRSAWMFIRNPEVEIPDHRPLMKKSYVVSVRGEVRGFEEVYPDREKCQHIVDYMSDYFDEKGI